MHRLLARFRSMPPGRLFAMDALAGLLLAAAVFALGHRWGMTQLPGFDAGPMVDLAWRMTHGLRPNVDFPSPFPPSFTLPAKWAFEALGVRWASLSLLGAGFGAVLSALCFWTWAPVVGRRLALALAALAAAQMPLIDGFWWYGSSAGIAALALAGAVLADAKLRERSPGASAGRVALWALQAALLAFLFGAKPNEAWPMAVAALAAMAAPRALWGMGRAGHAVAIAAIAAALLAFACATSGFPLCAYAEFMARISHRAAHFPLMDSKRPLADRVAAIAALAAACGGFAPNVFGSCAKANYERLKNGRLFVIIGLVGSFLGAMFLNADCVLQAAPLLAAALALGIEAPSRKRMAAIILCWMAGMALALVLGQMRFRVQEGGVGQFWEEPKTLSVIHGGFFDGLRSGPRLQAFLAQSKEAIATVGSKNVFFGPRVEFGYAAFNLRSPAGLPLWWDPKVAYAPNETARHVRQWIEARPDLVLIDDRDSTYMPLAIMDQWSTSYQLMSEPAQNGGAEATIIVSDQAVARIKAAAEAKASAPAGR